MLSPLLDTLTLTPLDTLTLILTLTPLDTLTSLDTLTLTLILKPDPFGDPNSNRAL